MTLTTLGCTNSRITMEYIHYILNDTHNSLLHKLQNNYKFYIKQGMTLTTHGYTNYKITMEFTYRIE